MEKTITTAIAQTRTSLTELLGLSKEYLQKVQKIRQTYLSYEDFNQKVNPDTQLLFGSDERQSIMGDYSTLATLDLALGANTATNWLVTLIGNLNMFIGCKNMDDYQTEWLARLLSQEYRDVKYSVIQLFFYRFKCGDFGRFYGTVDPMVITCALKDFLVICDRKRQRYMAEEYNQRKADEETHRQKQREQWFSFQSELCTICSDEEGKRLFQSLGYVTYDADTLLLRVTREDYALIEGRYFDVFSSVIRKHYPSAKVQYSLSRESVLCEEVRQEHCDADTIVRQQREIQQGIKSARAVIDNRLGLDRDVCDKMRYSFKLRYKYEPEAYLELHTSNRKHQF